jgi:hypothetical protein
LNDSFAIDGVLKGAANIPVGEGRHRRIDAHHLGRIAEVSSNDVEVFLAEASEGRVTRLGL